MDDSNFNLNHTEKNLNHKVTATLKADSRISGGVWLTPEEWKNAKLRKEGYERAKDRCVARAARHGIVLEEPTPPPVAA